MSHTMPDVPLLSMRVLIVEDDTDLRAILKLLIEHRFGFEVIEAKSAELGLDLARQEKLDLILMDLVLPKMGGLEAIPILKATPEAKHIEIIVISDHAWEREVQERARLAGALACVDKSHLLKRLPPLIAATMGLRWELSSEIGAVL